MMNQNWMIEQTEAMRRKIIAARKPECRGIEEFVEMVAEVKDMSWRELDEELKATESK